MEEYHPWISSDEDEESSFDEGEWWCWRKAPDEKEGCGLCPGCDGRAAYASNGFN